MTPLAEGHVIAGRYRLERPLSRGGMGSVWVARHLDLGMAVAVKLMDPLMAARPEWRLRFAREAKAAGAIQSPHVVKVHDYGVDADTPYLVMELLAGEDLRTRLRREGRLSLEATARLVLALAKGLKRAHEAGVVHRDLKPANVFLARVDDDERVQILDFGIAKLTGPDGDGERTETGVVMGSIHYMSPEQARGFRDADHRADVWSLGVIAYRALTGELPFPGEESGDVLVKLCTDPAPAASTRLRGLDGNVARKLDLLFARALAKSPAERFQTARDLADALCAIAGLESEAATTTSTTASAAAVVLDAAGDEAPSRTAAIPGLGAAAAAEVVAGPATESASFETGTVESPTPLSKSASRSRRAAWGIGGTIALAALAALLMGLSFGGGPGPGATTTAVGSPLATISGAASSTAIPPDPQPSSIAAAAPSTAVTAPETPSLAAPRTTTSASVVARTPAPSSQKPATRPDDRVKAKFGF